MKNSQFKTAFYLLLGILFILGFVGGCSVNKYFFNKSIDTQIQVDSTFNKGVTTTDTTQTYQKDTFYVTNFVPEYITQTKYKYLKGDTVRTIDTLYTTNIDFLNQTGERFTLTYYETFKGDNYEIKDKIIVMNDGGMVDHTMEVETTKEEIFIETRDTINITKTITKLDTSPKLLIGGAGGINNLNEPSIDATAAFKLNNFTITASKELTSKNGFKIGALFNINSLFKKNKDNSQRTKKNKRNSKKLLSFLAKKKLRKELSKQ